MERFLSSWHKSFALRVAPERYDTMLDIGEIGDIAPGFGLDSAVTPLPAALQSWTTLYFVALAGNGIEIKPNVKHANIPAR